MNSISQLYELPEMIRGKGLSRHNTRYQTLGSKVNCMKFYSLLFFLGSRQGEGGGS